ncbi:hypothetical protein CROQUDRAFT_654120 [Cronartium quercuum f. sp. fusiforme G11]|uniref:Stc1 domain-containing protein n=1 Tax=Cronartium quercuum f. sp. fusiforme G11 TaxID=708437 RepID=A0A9P6NL43_9BASI|nr:hypothetical protein CROQUDRAFT_654120 [Cronartium quercuum f. sp. fusiforme G11]
MPAIRSSKQESASSSGLCKQSEIFCTRCRLIKGLNYFDGHQLEKRFGRLKTKSPKFKDYDAKHERERGADSSKVLKKIWCRQCVPHQVEQAKCSGCEEELPRAQFSQAQLKRTKTDDDRLCRACSYLTLKRIEADRLGKHFDVEMIDQKLDARIGNRPVKELAAVCPDYDDDDDDDDV